MLVLVLVYKNKIGLNLDRCLSRFISKTTVFLDRGSIDLHWHFTVKQSVSKMYEKDKLLDVTFSVFSCNCKELAKRNCVGTTDATDRQSLDATCAGEKSHLFCGFFLNFSLFGTGVVYTLTSATSMR
jgi:hypothetical protein